jgi:hypothetical protein
MRYLLAKALEVSGLVTLLWALYIGLSGQGMFTEVAMLAVGAAVFYLGRALEVRSSGRG